MVRLHALAYAAAASGKDAITASTEFREMIARHGLSVKDAAHFPFKEPALAAKFQSILRCAGTPE